MSPDQTKIPLLLGRTKRSRKNKNKTWTHLHCIGFLLFVAFLLSAFIGGVLNLFVLLDIPDIRSIESYQPSLTTQVLDDQSQVIAQFFSENRLFISQDEIPKLLGKAFIAAEDARFYHHPGVDYWSILRAAIHNVKVGGRGQGGSTITQQVTRSLLLTRKKLYSRKIKEAILAYRIDSLLSKDEILSIYLNHIYLGEGAYGVGAAARTYFGKLIDDLSIAEIALLAGLPKAPSHYSPFKDMELAKKRQAYVLNRMAEEGYITPTTARKAYKEPLKLIERKNTADFAYFIQHVRNYVERKYGKQIVKTGGLTIHTTLNRTIQAAAAKAISNGVNRITKKKIKKRPNTSPQGSLVAMDLHTGRILAMTGGIDFYKSQFNRATQAKRQPGSAFKPIIYAAAIEKGFTPATEIDDSPLRLPGSSPGKLWEPKNFDGKFNGPTSLRDGLIYSRNIITIKLLQQIGIDSVTSLAKKLGINSPLTTDLSLALGSADVTLLDLTAAYSAFGNGGKTCKPIFITKIVDSSGKILEENKPISKDVINKITAYQITLMLKGAIEEGTGKKAKGLGIPAAGKTGTTDRYMDAWFIGYTPDIVAGIWIGHDQMKSLGTGKTGGNLAAPVWLDFMKGIIDTTGRNSRFQLPY